MDRRAPAGLLEADRRQRQELVVAERAGVARGLGECGERLLGPPGAMAGVTEPERDRRAVAFVPRDRAREPSGTAPRPRRRRARRQPTRRPAGCSPPRARRRRAARRRRSGGRARPAGARPSTCGRPCSRASATRRWSSALRADGRRSAIARRTSSCAKRNASPRPGSSTSRPLRTASSIASSSAASVTSAARRTVSSSNSVPATAASSSSPFASPESRVSRWLTTSRTVVGAPSSAAGRASRALMGPTTIAPDSISSRQSSLTRNAFPPVSSPIGRAQVAGRLDAGREAHEFRDLVLREPAEPDPNHALRAVDVDERVRERRRACPPRRRGRSPRAASAPASPNARGGASAGASRRRPSGRPRARAGAAPRC